MIRNEAREIHFSKHARELQLAELLDEGFDITSGKLVEQYSTWIAEPKANIRERFGLSKEVLAVYSRYDRQDARVLRFIAEYLTRPAVRDRLDQTLVLLVHEGTSEHISDV